jgi:hypothetical protein
MSAEHVVKDGEYLSLIAADYGFATYKSIYDHPNNADFKAKRKNPNVLFPGDVVFIPDWETKAVTGATEKRHCFQLCASPVKLRIIVKDENDEPIANATFSLTVEGNTCTVKTDGNGNQRRTGAIE